MLVTFQRNLLLIIDFNWQTNIEAIQETVSGALANKNPQVKAETAAFLSRAFCYCTPTVFNKKLLKVYITDLVKTLNESGIVKKMMILI